MNYVEPDHTYRIGRCNSCSNRPPHAWRAGTLKLTEARCLTCNRLLDATTRDCRAAFRLIEGQEAFDMLKRAASETYASLLDRMEEVNAWQAEGDDFRAGLVQQYADDTRKRHADLAKRVRKMYEAGGVAA